MDRLTQVRLIERLHYDPETGIFRHAGDIKVGNANALVIVRKHETAGYVNDRGYVVISLDCKEYRAHRLAWLYQTGQFPNNGTQIDHINGVRHDNRWQNLRLATNAENSQNERKARSGNCTGFLGVSRHRSGKFKAQITVLGKATSLGVHATAQGAHQAYLQAKRVLHPFSTI